jgi:hypothetical protein
VEENIRQLSRLEKENCPNPDLPASCFGALMGELLVYREDLWAPTLRKIGMALGRFIYLADGAEDYRRDKKQGKYNPLLLRYGQDVDDTALEDTMLHSLEMAASALQLGQFGCRMPVLENILYLGLPLVQKAVFNGSWSQIKNQKIWSNDT